MTDEEKAYRLGSISELFAVFDKPISETQLRLWGNLLKHVPAPVFRDACMRAAVLTTGSFPPGPGAVLEAALELAPGGYTPGQGAFKPRWYQAATFKLRGGVVEKPREIGGRGPVSVMEIAKASGE